MDEWYNYLQHNFSMLIYLDEKGFHTRVYKTEIQTEIQEQWFRGREGWHCSSVLYDTEFDRVTEFNSRSVFSDSTIHIDNFLHRLSDLYQKDNWNDQDKLTFKIVGKALDLFVNEEALISIRHKQVGFGRKRTFIYNPHYVFVLHLDCMQVDFEEKIIRPLFIQANLITSNDHRTRLQVFTELDYLVHRKRSTPEYYKDRLSNYSIFNARRDFNKKKDIYLISKLDITNINKPYWSYHAFEFVETIKFGDQKSTSFHSTLAPRSIQGLPATEKKLKIGAEMMIGALSDLIQSKHDSQHIPTEENIEIIMRLIIDYFYDEKILDRYISNNDNKKGNNGDTHDEAKLDTQLLDYYNKAISTDNFRTENEVLLDEDQQMLIKNVSVLDIYNKLLAPIQSDIKKHIEVFATSGDTFMNSVNKLYIMSMLKRAQAHPLKTWFATWIERWFIRVLLHYEKSMNYILIIENGNDYEDDDEEGEHNSETDSGSNSNYKIRQNFSNGGIFYTGGDILDYAQQQLIRKIQNGKMEAPPFFVNSYQQVTLPPEEISNINSRSAGELLPILQEKFHVNLELKAYYLQVQLHQEYIQLTLNQAVKIASDKEDAASFLVEDRAISIENIYDSFCKRILNCGGLLIDDQPCDIHHQQATKSNNNRDQRKALATDALHHTKKDNYEEAAVNLKERFNEIIRSTTDDGLDIDVVKRMVKVNSVCGCRLSVSMRDFIEIALIPTIIEIIVAISGALINKQDFGRYNINHVFLILGDLFEADKDGASSSALMMEILANVVQDALKNTNDEKEIQPDCFYCIDTVKSLDIQAQQRQQEKIPSRPVGSSSPFNDGMAINVKGTIRPVSRGTYGFRVFTHWIITRFVDLFQQVDGTTDKLESATDAIHSPIIIVEKGQHIPIEGIHKVVYFKFRKEIELRSIFEIDIFKIHHNPHLQSHSPPEDGSHNDFDSSGRELIFTYQSPTEMNNYIGNRFSSSTKDLLIPIYLSIKYDHPDSVLKIHTSYGLMNVDPSFRSDIFCIHQSLTLGYFQST